MTNDEIRAIIRKFPGVNETDYFMNPQDFLDDHPEIKDQIEIEGMFSERPKFDAYSITNPDGSLKDQFNVNAKPFLDQINGVKMDDGGYKALQQRALWDPAKQGDSPWMKLMKQQMNLQRQDAAQTLSAQQAGAAAQARSQLAMRGGLSGGAAMSLARQGARDLSRGQQGLARQNLMNQSNLGIQDEQMRNNMQTQLAGFEGQRFNSMLGQAQASAQMGLQNSQWNMGNAIKDMSNRGQFDLDAWNKKMEVMGSYRNARATE